VAQHATAQGAAAYPRRFDAQLTPDHFRTAQGWSVSSIGLGTYLGVCAVGHHGHRPRLPAAGAARRAIQFVRSAPGVTTAVVGMKQAVHVEEDLALGRMSPASPAQFMQLFRQTAPAH
jgi:hypothetical protein